MNVPEIVNNIDELYSAIRKTCRTPNEIACKINSILIHGDEVPHNLLSAAWDEFAKLRGIKNE